MKKFKRIVFTVLLLVILILGVTVLFQEFKHVSSIAKKLKDDPSLLIPIHLTFFSVFSFLFNINKFYLTIDLKSKIYKALRIGDFVFTISTSIFIIIAIYLLTQRLDEIEITTNFFLIRAFIILLFLAFSVLLFIDNISIHKEQKRKLKKDNIDEIGLSEF